VLANFSDAEQSVSATLLDDGGLARPVHLHSTTDRLELHEGTIQLPAWGHLWLTTT
jgi:hypothetical protein